MPWYYPLLAVHTAAGAVAVSLAWLQVWPWLRERHPKFHRRVGWTYLLAGVLPAGLAAYPIAVLTTSGQPTRVVLFVIAVLWSITAVAGLRGDRPPVRRPPKMPATGIWTALVIHLVFVEWYLLRPRRRAPLIPTRTSAERLAEATLVGD